MKSALISALWLSGCAAAAPISADIRFDNGAWYEDGAFRKRIAYVEDGRLWFSKKRRAAQTVVDIEGGFVVPPFCEAHNHNLGGGADEGEFNETARAYLADGVFYAMMPGSFALYRAMIADRINTPTSVDVAFANNALTGSGGHPVRLREQLMARYGAYPEFTKETMPDKGYFEADTLEALKEKWALVLAERPNFIKAALLFSEEYEKRKDDPRFYGERGLDPALLPPLVGMAHAAGLRVAVHVESDFDMATALGAGADIIAHMVSNDSDARLSDATIALAKTTGAVVVTTLSVAKRVEKRDPERYRKIGEAQRENMRRLVDAGVKLAVGSDNVQDTSRGEVEYLRSLGVLDNRTLLDMWTGKCAKTVFPDRKIGALQSGYEASFLVLEGNPIDDFDHVDAIRLRVKDGSILDGGGE